MLYYDREGETITITNDKGHILIIKENGAGILVENHTPDPDQYIETKTKRAILFADKSRKPIAGDFQLII